mmetsp:Transcript_59553/g.122006  ORF Transcript_59553/g.122006 Transcript_59553/m.122006 type:complete len:215 (-) Transcript_59553:110-754(-)
MTSGTREQLLHEVSAVFCEFLECATHTILFVRNVYPAELFERRRKYNVPVRQSRHKDLNDYISGAVADVKIWMDRGLVEKVVLSIEDCSTRQQIERFVFEVDVDVTGQPTNSPSKGLVQAHSLADLEDALRQVLLKINVADSLLPSLSKDITFSLYVHTPTTVQQENDNWEALPGEGPTGGGAIAAEAALVPLKSVHSGALRLQLYAQSQGRRQ